MTSPATTRNVTRSAVPLVTMGATWAARKGLAKGYEAKTGKPAPVVRSRESSLLSKILWAAALAAVIALIEAVIWNAVGEEEEDVVA